MARVDLAALAAGLIASALGLQHAYWAIAAAVLMLHEGRAWAGTIQRSLARVLGTLAGLVLAGLILAASPRGLWLVGTVALLQFLVELLVVRNYALAVAFITPLALVIASGGRQLAGLTPLLSARAVDTAIGCTVALVVYRLTIRPAGARRLPQAMAAVLEAVARVSPPLADGAVTTKVALAARRDLQAGAMDVRRDYDAAAGGTTAQRDAARQLWPAVVAVQRVAYQLLAACWVMEQDASPEAARAHAQQLYGAGGEAELDREIRALAIAIRTGTEPGRPGQPPAFIAAEFTALRAALHQHIL